MIEIIGNSCFPYENGVYLRTITFNLITSAKDQQNNVIPIKQLSGGRSQIQVNPRFVTYVSVETKSSKNPVIFNTPMCDEDDASEEIVYMPMHKSNDMTGLYNVGVTPFSIRWNGKRCLKTGDLSQSLYNNCNCSLSPRGYFTEFKQWGVTGAKNGKRFAWFKQIDVCSDEFLYKNPYSENQGSTTKDNGDGTITISPINTPGGFLQLTFGLTDKFDSICLLSETTFLVSINNASNTKTSYYVVNASAVFGANNTVDLNTNNLLYTITSGWASNGMNYNKMIKHGSKIYHFQESSSYGIDKPSAVRILDVSKSGYYGATITGHKTGYNNNGPNNSAIVWPTNLFSTKHGLLASSGFIAKMVDYRVEGSKIKLDSIVLSNNNNFQLVDGNTMSVSKK